MNDGGTLQYPGDEPQQPLYSPDGRYWWNGQQWVAVTRSGGSQPPQPPGPPMHPSGVADGPRNVSGAVVVAAVVGGLLIFGSCLSALSGTSAVDQSDTAAVEVADAGSDLNLPKAQVAFLKAVAAGQEAAEGANELEVVEARKARSVALCAAVPENLTVENWVGEVSSIETTLGGDAGVVELTVARDVQVGTWNNALSDLLSDTLIEPESRMWDSVIDLDPGDRVYFSGRFDRDRRDCITESSVIDENGMLTPSFIIAFTDIGPVDDGPLAATAQNSAH